MTRKVQYFLSLLLFLVIGTSASFADFKNFSVQVNNQAGTLLTSDEQVQGTEFSFGVAVADDGTVSRVEAGDASSVATVSGKFHSDHGATGLNVVVPVDGTVKITVAQCTYSSNAITIKDASGAVVATKTPSSPACWKNSKTNVDELYYTGDATTLTISGMGYCAYVAVEKTEAVIQKYAITYSLGEQEAEGVVPTAVTFTEGDSYSIPLNRTLYKEGYTLTGWTDGGTRSYAPGEAFTPTADVTLTPIFTPNTASLADRTDAVTVKWDFQRKNGAPTLAYQNKDGIYVTQATVNGQAIDVKLDFSTTLGKIANANWTDWCQMNNGTKFTIPSCKGAVVSIEAYSAPTTTTIDGLTDYTASGSTISMEVGSKAETIDIVIGDGSYYRYIQTVLPVVKAEGGKTYTNEPATVTFAMNDTENPGAYTTTLEDAFQTVAFDYETNANIIGARSITDQKAATIQASALKIQPKTGKTDVIAWQIKPAVGLTFTPTHITGLVNRDGTDVENGVTISVKSGTKDAVTLGTYTAWRAGKNASTKDYDASAIYQYDITLTAEQQATLATADMLYLQSTVGVANNKDAVFGQVVIEGTVSGTIANVNKYTVAVASAPEEGGSATIYPKSDEYVEGDEVTLTATENFGYDFVNWTNAAGEEVSTEAKFKYTVTANETLTANFKKVNTYELAVTLEGGANDYMISLSPAPTVVDNKNMYEEGTKVTMTAASNRILTFTNWSNGETAAEMAITMNEDKAFTASYSAIDFIAGWDFYSTTSTGAPDFYGNADNAGVTFGLVNAEGTTHSYYLRPYNNSYEDHTCALNWNMLADKWYWQTTVNATEYKNIKIESIMMYNYNAYSVQKLEASLDGENWETITTQDLGGTKNWEDVNGSLPEKYNNQAKVWLRWIPDYTSDVKGTTSNNDGTSITNIFILGDKELIDDGKAPAFVSSVPADGSEGASANGKIVLTFDEKVKLTEDAGAALTTEDSNKIQELTPVVSGKTVICEYKGLDYSTAYTFTLFSKSISDLTNNVLATPVTINFTTKVKPAVEKGLYDAIVSTAAELDSVIAVVNNRANQNTRYRVFIKNGKYVLAGSGEDKTVSVTLADKSTASKTYKNPVTYLTASNVSFIGEDYNEVEITNKAGDLEYYQGQYGQACVAEGIRNGDVLSNSGTLNYYQGLTIKTSMGDAHGRDIAFNDTGNKTIFKDARLWGYQDTYYSGGKKYYFEGGVIRGRTDYLCGKGDAYFNGVTLQQCGTGGFIAVPSTAKQYGYVFNDCYIKKETSDVTFYLGRPWGSGTPTASFINTKMDQAPAGNGWADMSGGYPKRFAEYNSYLTSGAQLDLSGRRTSWTDNSGVAHANDPILTIEDVKAMSLENVMGQDDDWDPTVATEQASAPKGVELADNQLSWENSNYVLCWAVCKNGNVVDFTIEPSYTVDDATAKWSVRAANEMGGLGEATEASISTGISEIAKPVINNSNVMYNIAGQRVNATAKGVVIVNGQKIMMK